MTIQDHRKERLDDEAAVRVAFDRLAESWNRGDGAAYGRLFTEDGDYVVFDGTHLKGAQEIGSSHQRLFESWLKGSRLLGRIEDLRFLGPEVALLHATGAVLQAGQSEPSPEAASIQTMVAVRRDDGEWCFAAFQNTRVQQRPPERG